MSSYFSHHVTIKRMTPPVKENVVDNYLDMLDPSRMLLLQPEAASIRGQLTSFLDDFRGRDCNLLLKLNELVDKKALAMEKFVRAVVSAPNYALDKTVTLVQDPKKRGYQKTQKDLEKLYTKMIHFQISNYLIDNTDLAEAKRLLIHRYELRNKWRQEIAREDILSGFLSAFAAALDPHSAYFSKRDLEEFKISMELSLEGIGAVLSSDDGFTTIEEIVPGGAADRSGLLRPKDKIIAVAQQGEPPVNIIDMRLSDVVRLIRGKRGTKISLILLREGDKTQRRQVTLVRDKIDLNRQAASLSFVEHAVGQEKLRFAVIELPSFYGGGGDARSSYKDVRRLLLQLKDEKADGLLFDLARNGGGLLNDAVQISGLFINAGGIVATQDARDGNTTLTDDDNKIFYTGPMVVRTSRRSASGAEILAGALKDYHRAIIVGDERTFGKGTVQVVLPLPPGFGALKVTSGMFFRPSGHSTQQRGVLSDIRIPSVLDTDEIGERELPASLPPQAIAPFVSHAANSTNPAKHWQPVTQELLRYLTPRSQERVAQSEELQKVLKELREAETNKGIIRLADLEHERHDHANDDPTKSQLERIKEAEAPQRNEALNVLSDVVRYTRRATKLHASGPTGGSSANPPTEASPTGGDVVKMSDAPAP